MRFILILSSILLVNQGHTSDLTSLAAPLKLSVTTTAALALPVNRYRKYLLIVNNGAATVIAKPDSAPASGEGVQIIAGGNWEPFVVPMNAIYLVSSSGTNQVTVLEGN